jgi:hypothetical protein
MLDLNKLQAKFDSFFEQESEGSFKAWLQERKEKEMIANLGVGEIEIMETKFPIMPEGLLMMPTEVLVSNGKDSIAGNTQYAMAS